nr:juvenile hormone acid O-methyltransferase-like isoform X1 [Leptinotarsa decemlineata]
MKLIYPELFAANNQVTTVITERILKKYSHLIKWRNEATIMEIGYADGGSSQRSFHPYLPSNLKEFIAVDKSDTMLEYAKQHYMRPSIKFDQLDITTKQVPSKYLNRFDHIFGFLLMDMVQDPKQAFHNMYRMLKPGGSIFQTFFEYTPVDDSVEKLTKDPEWNKYGVENLLSPYYYSPNPRREWERDLDESDFQNYDLFEYIDSYDFLDGNEFDNVFLSFCMFLPNIPYHKQESFKKVYRALTRKDKTMSFRVVDGKEIISLNYKVFVVSASKV